MINVSRLPKYEIIFILMATWKVRGGGCPKKG